MAKYKIEIRIPEKLIKEIYKYEPENVGEIMKDLFMIECDKKTDRFFKTRKKKFKHKNQVTTMLNKLKE